MLKTKRSLCLDVFDYNQNKLCNLYDSTSDVVGQAKDVFVKTERNGTKILTFTIPSTCPGENGNEHNFRLDYLIADYKIRTFDGTEHDWFLISEPRIKHDSFSQNVYVTCQHVSHLLTTKNLNLEFSDEEGNNVGTARQLGECILEGTGWHLGYVDEFVEDDDPTKIKTRSLQAPVRTGAFRLMTQMCELFDAKPIYHGQGTYIDDQGNQQEGYVVDIVHMNPFSDKLQPGEIPQEVLGGKQVLELHYDKNIKNLERIMNTESIVTRLYAYGSPDDFENQTTLQSCKHIEYTFVVPGRTVNTECNFRDFENNIRYFMMPPGSATRVIYSNLDAASRSYVWDINDRKAYSVYKEAVGSTSQRTLDAPESQKEVQNYFPSVMDFSYYQSIGLFSDEMLQKVALYQRDGPNLIQTVQDKSLEMSNNLEELSNLGESNGGFLKLKVNATGAGTRSIIDINTNTGDNGVIYRSDYAEAKRNYFAWFPTKQLKTNGSAAFTPASILYVIHPTSPVTWESSYIHHVGRKTGNSYDWYALENGDPAPYRYDSQDFQEPNALELWTPLKIADTDTVFLFRTHSQSGLIGPKEDAVFSAIDSLTKATTVETVPHPTHFVWDDTVPATSGSYSWYYKGTLTSFSVGSLYFNYPEKGDAGWKLVHVGAENPASYSPTKDEQYFFQIREKKVYNRDGGKWVWLNTAKEKEEITSAFIKVYTTCMSIERTYKGLKEKYYYQAQNVLPRGNYALYCSAYKFYWTFTTNQDIAANHYFVYTPSDRHGWQNITNIETLDTNIDNMVSPVEKTIETLDFPALNEVDNMVFTEGNLDANGANAVSQSKDYIKSSFAKVHENLDYQYKLVNGSKLYLYDENDKFVTMYLVSDNTWHEITTPENVKKVKICLPKNTEVANCYLRAKERSSIFYANDIKYTILSTSATGNYKGLIYCISRFKELADIVYIDNRNAIETAQKDVADVENGMKNELGEIYREGWWQDNNYVIGDEPKLYKDALDNLYEVAKPETTYNFTFLDLYGADKGAVIDESLGDIDWPDITINDAAHLVDPDIGTNCWAYIDSINKCFDRPWKTEIEINTRLSMIGQQSFTDVLAKIAEVANETKAKQSLYKKGGYIGSMGQITADRLEGKIKTNSVFVTGGTSNWYTDDKGNMIFESSDGETAIMITGRGIALANAKDAWGDWIWRGFVTGDGFTGDEMVSGFISGTRIEAGTIAADRLESAVGSQLDISSNVALNLYATEDGERPSGGLLTPLKEGDSQIIIAASSKNNQGETVPAYIDIASGGNVYIRSGSNLSLQSNSNLSIESGSNIDITATKGSVSISTGCEFLVDSANFKIKKDSSGNYTNEFRGKIIADSGKIGGDSGWDISSGKITSGSGDNTVTLHSGSNSVYAIWAGNSSAGSAPFYVTKAGTLKATSAKIEGEITATSGKIGSFTIGTGIYSSTKSTIDTNIAGVFIGTDGISLGTTIKYPDGTTRSKFKVTDAGALYAQDATIVGAIEASSGRIGCTIAADGTLSGGWYIGSNFIANNSVLGNSTIGMYHTASSDTSKVFWSGGARSGTPTFYVQANGKLHSSDIEITGGSIKITNGQSGTSARTYLNASSSGLTVNGTIYSTSGTIGGWHIGSSFIGNNPELNLSTIGMYETPLSDTTRVFWAGGTYNGSPTFYVQANGKLYASGAEIAGSSTFKGELKGATGTFSGELSAATGTFKGTLSAGTVSSSNISGSTITGGSLKITNNQTGTSEVVYLDASSSGLTVKGTITGSTITGSTITTTSEKFNVDDDGILSATEAKISGILTASAGSNVGGWYIGSDYIGNKNTKEAGTIGMAYVAEPSSSTAASNTVFWAGGRYDTVTGNSKAGFRVFSNGTVSMNRFYTDNWDFQDAWIWNREQQANSITFIGRRPTLVYNVTENDNRSDATKLYFMYCGADYPDYLPTIAGAGATADAPLKIAKQRTVGDFNYKAGTIEARYMCFGVQHFYRTYYTGTDEKAHETFKCDGGNEPEIYVWAAGVDANGNSGHNWVQVDHTKLPFKNNWVWGGTLSKVF